jgi:uncharacterized membrane protein YphA (DoxX/SURF4 family)
LRVVLGLHFLVEGVTKLQDERPFSAPFFASARGPLAPYYQAKVWDADGLYRLDKDATLGAWDSYRSRLIGHYGFDEKQTKRADAVLNTYKHRYLDHLDDNADAVDEYRQQLARRERNADDPTRQLASLQVHDTRIAAETKKLYGDLVPPIDAMWKHLERELNAVATPEQWNRHGTLSIGKVGRRFGDSEMMDAVMPYFDVVIGVCLLIGLLTRPAAILAAIFLASVFVSRFPPEAGPGSTYYHLVELTALVAIAAIGAGKYLGLDYFLGRVCCRRKKTGETK